MRVTNSMLVSNFMNNLSTNLNKMSNLQNQMTSNRKFLHISDDPIAVIFGEQARYKLNRLEHYQQNVNTATNWLSQAETSAMDINNILQSAYESCIEASTNVMGVTDLKNVSQAIGQFRDALLSTLNSSLGDKYIYGGYNTTGYIGSDGRVTPPFTLEEYTVSVQARDSLTRDLVYKTDAYGNYLYVQATDASGNLLTGPVKVQAYEEVLDSSGNPVTDASGNTIYKQKLDMEGNAVYKDYDSNVDFAMSSIGVDANGEPLYIATTSPATSKVPVYEQALNPDGSNMIDGNGNPVYLQKLDANGNPVYQSLSVAPIINKIPVMEDVIKHELFYNGFNVTHPEKNFSDPSSPTFISNPADRALKIQETLDSLRADCLTLDIGLGIDMEITLNGLDLIFYEKGDESKNIFNLLDDLYASVNHGDDVPDLTLYIPELQKAQNHVLALTATIGGKTNRLEMLEIRYGLDELNYTQMKSDAEDSDLSEVVMKFKMAEAVYHAALSAGARIIQPTLMDFLR